MQARLAAPHPAADSYSRRGADSHEGEACRLRNTNGVGQQREPSEAVIRGNARHCRIQTGASGWAERHAEHGWCERCEIKLHGRHNGRLLSGYGQPGCKGSSRGQPAQCQRPGQQTGARGKRTAKSCSHGRAASFQAAGAWAADAGPSIQSAGVTVICAPMSVFRPIASMNGAGRRTRSQGVPRPGRKCVAWSMRAGGRHRAGVRQARVHGGLMDVQVRDMAHSRPVRRLSDKMADRSAGGI